MWYTLIGEEIMVVYSAITTKVVTPKAILRFYACSGWRRDGHVGDAIKEVLAFINDFILTSYGNVVQKKWVVGPAQYDRSGVVVKNHTNFYIEPRGRRIEVTSVNYSDGETWMYYSTEVEEL
jgi:hypothetical protein